MVLTATGFKSNIAGKYRKPYLVDMSFSSFELLDYSQPILVFGRDGQVGKALQASLKHLETPVIFLGRAECDLSDESSILQVLNRYQPQVIINAAAYTDVDQAETDPDLAFAVNAHAPKVMANYITNLPDGIFVHYSTDYVFADTKQTAYVETDITGPAEQLSVYGQSKLTGEKAIEEVFKLVQNSEGEEDEDIFSRYYILRTSWVYGNGENFIRAILRLASERDQLRVIADQVGVPTSAQWLGNVTLQLIGSKLESGIYHAVPDGETSWYGLAVVAIEFAALVGAAIQVKSGNICPISAGDYLSPVKRSYNSRMNNQKLKQALTQVPHASRYPHWQEQVEAYVKEYVMSLF